MSETREAGFYHVAISPAWPEIMLWNGKIWTREGSPTWLNDSELTYIGPRVQTPAEIAAAIAAARAEGVAIGAANMREACRLSVVISAGEAWSRDAAEALDIARQRITTLSLPTDADAILRAERAKGAEATRAAIKIAIGAKHIRSEIDMPTAREINREIDALEVLP